MILDEEVVQLFRNTRDIPVSFTDSEIAGKKIQIFRGISAHLWKDAHPGSCTRHFAVFNKFNVIPKYCFGCYKVLIAPRTVMELFKLLMIFEKIALPHDNTRKCMVEVRNDSPGTYKGFIYCRGIEEGKEVRKILRQVISDDISHQVPVTLKRGCSEFASVYPGYAQIKPGSVMMQYRKDWQIHEDLFDKNFGFHRNVPEVNADIPLADTNGKTKYTPWEIFCMRFWLSYAATIGDISYLVIAGMTMPPIPNLRRPPFGATTPLKRNK